MQSEFTTQLYDMKLHEVCVVNDEVKVMRVPSGWIYFDCMASTFVPYDNYYLK